MVDRLEFGYTTKVRKNGTTKWQNIDDDDIEICNKKIEKKTIQTYEKRILLLRILQYKFAIN